ncbi:MAG: eIF2A-related protein [Pyrinomonadaceae bacterium]
MTNGKVLGNAAFSADGRAVALMEGDKEKPRPDPSAASAPTPTGMPDMASMPDFSKVMEQMKKDPKKIEAEMKKAQEALAKGDLGAGMQMMETLGIMPKKPNASPNNLRILETDSGRQVSVIPQSSSFMSQMSPGSLMSSSTLAFSPDGRVLAATMGYSSPIQLTDVTTGQQLHTLKTPYSMGINSLAWSSDGKRLASAAWGMKKGFTPTDTAQDFTFEDMTFSIKLWDAQTGTEVSTLAGHNNFVMRMAFSPDGRLLASGGFDNTIKIWDVNTGRQLRSFVGHAGSITALDFTPDGKFIVSGSDDGSARLWSTETGALRATLVSLNQGNDWLVVTPDGLFDGSPGGWNQILWRFTPTTFDVSPVEIFFNEYFYPGLLPDILMGKKLSASSDISQKDRRQPKIALAAAEVPAGSVSTRELKLKIQISEAPAGARDLRLFRNGSLVKVWRGDVLGGQSNASVETTVSITAGENQFTAYAFNRDNVKSTDATLLVTGAANLKRAATLHLLAVGVNRYANAGYDLKYAVADGQAFATEVEQQQKKLGQYAEIKVTTLFDQQATKANLMYALGRLTSSFKRALPAGAPPELERIAPAQPEDAVVVD